MGEKEIKIGDIAQIIGISEQDVRTLIRTYEGLFTYRTIGSVRLFSGRAVATVRDILELSGRGLTPEEIVEEVGAGKRSAAPKVPAEEVSQAGAPLPPEVVLDLPVMQDTLAWQERRIRHLTGELEREREMRREEIDRLREVIDRLQGDLDRQQEQLAIIAEWVAYFDRQIDEVSRPALERIRRTFGR